MKKILILLLFIKMLNAGQIVTVITKTDTMIVPIERIDYDYDVLIYARDGENKLLPLRHILEIRDSENEILFSHAGKPFSLLGDHYRKEMLMEENLKSDTEMKVWIRRGIQYALALNTLALLLLAI